MFTLSKMTSETNRIVTVRRKSFQEHISLNTGRKPADTYCLRSNLTLKKDSIFAVFMKQSENWLPSQWSNKRMKLFSFSQVCCRKLKKKIQNSAWIPLVRLQDFGLWCCQCKCAVSSWQKSERLGNLLWHMRFSSDGLKQQSLWMDELSNVSSNASKDT